MREYGLGVVQQRGIVFSDGVMVGEYAGDLLAEDQIIIEVEGPKVEIRRVAAQP